jgi:GNAT superfamily N-acetyltransferase
MWRPARPEDRDEIVSMCLALYREDPGLVPVEAEQVHETLAVFERQPGRGRAVVAELGGGVAGYALLVPFWSNELAGEICDVDELYVRPDRRGQGARLGALRRDRRKALRRVRRHGARGGARQPSGRDGSTSGSGSGRPGRRCSAAVSCPEMSLEAPPGGDGSAGAVVGTRRLRRARADRSRAVATSDSRRARVDPVACAPRLARSARPLLGPGLEPPEAVPGFERAAGAKEWP